MVWLAVDKDGTEYIYERCMPLRYERDKYWIAGYDKHGDTHPCIELPKGSIAKLIGRELTWDDEPYELKDE